MRTSCGWSGSSTISWNSPGQSPGRSAGAGETPLPAFLGRVAELHRPSAERAGKSLEVIAGEGSLRADLRKLALALSNLVDNAIKYGKEGAA